VQNLVVSGCRGYTKVNTTGESRRVWGLDLKGWFSVQGLGFKACWRVYGVLEALGFT
jgi:hypothetical protein